MFKLPPQYKDASILRCPSDSIRFIPSFLDATNKILVQRCSVFNGFNDWFDSLSSREIRYLFSPQKPILLSPPRQKTISYQ